MIPSQVSIKATTQDFIEIEDIKDDIVILRDGSSVLILSTTAINFGLLSQEEQEAAIYAYAALLNSLNFSIQILIRSRRKDITSYLKLLEEQIIKAPTKILRNQIKKYKKFVGEIVQVNQVLDKSFYVVIPMSSLEIGGTKKALTSLKGQKTLPFPKEYIIDKAKTNLFPKRDQLIRLLARLGLRSRQLTTQELITLFYEIYNPGAMGQIIASPGEYQAPIVKANLAKTTALTPAGKKPPIGKVVKQPIKRNPTSVSPLGSVKPLGPITTPAPSVEQPDKTETIRTTDVPNLTVNSGTNSPVPTPLAKPSSRPIVTIEAEQEKKAPEQNPQPKPVSENPVIFENKMGNQTQKTIDIPMAEELLKEKDKNQIHNRIDGLVP